MKRLSNIDMILIQTMIICILSFLQFIADAFAGVYYLAVFQILTNGFICFVICRIVDELQKDSKKSAEETEVKEHEENN